MFKTILLNYSVLVEAWSLANLGVWKPQFAEDTYTQESLDWGDKSELVFHPYNSWLFSVELGSRQFF